MAKSAAKDLRYTAIGLFISNGEIKTFEQIFDYKHISRHQLTKDLKMSRLRLAKLLEDPTDWRCGEVLKMAELFEVEPVKMFSIIIKKR